MKKVEMKDLKIIQEAYLNGYNEIQEANEYEITWLESEEFDPGCGDESQACDWDNPYRIERI